MVSFYALLLIPLVGALLSLLIKQGKAWQVLGKLLAACLVAATIGFVVQHHAVGQEFISLPSSLEGFPLDYVLLGGELLLSLVLIVISIKRKNILALLLVLTQTALTVVNDFLYKPGESDITKIFVTDRLSLIMVLIVGIVGALISLYAVGYMGNYHHHNPQVKDRRKLFFFILYLFLAAMFGLVLTDDLNWTHFFWEITTFCSFFLIGYNQDEVSNKNAFTALILNVLGGLGFTAAIMISEKVLGSASMSFIVQSKAALGSMGMLAVALLCFAGIVKSAQMPFTVWLLGAMVAPTPVSAMLHSATMVKAGVYLILRMAPLIGGTITGDMVALIGGLTFLGGSFFACSTSGSKRLLGYSTVANLGLIIACAGIGTYATIWAALFLMIFHAIAKSLLFLTVGVAGYQLNSLEIEDMDYLIVRMPLTAMLMLIGICGMFIAPFGMLISKWAALEAFIQLSGAVGPILILLLAFGSAATMFFWAKWMGKLLMVNLLPKNKLINERSMSFDEMGSMILLGALTVVVCVLFPLLSRVLVQPFTDLCFGPHELNSGNLIITSIMIGMIVVVPFLGLLIQKVAPVLMGKRYMGGAKTKDNGLTFENALKETSDMKLDNYYLGWVFSDKKGFMVFSIIAILLILALLGVSAL
jgi:ech hydrogenase subunit A